MASKYLSSNRTDEAIKLLQEIESEKVTLHRSYTHETVLSTRSMLASAYADSGRYQDAINLHDAVYRTRQRILGEDHPDTCSSWTAKQTVKQWKAQGIKDYYKRAEETALGLRENGDLLYGYRKKYLVGAS